MQGIPETRNSLIVRLRRPENQDAWREFASLYEPIILRLAERKGMQHADAQYLLQDVLIAVAKGIDRFEIGVDRGRFRGWLFTISRNLIINAIEKRQRIVMGKGESAAEVARILENELAHSQNPMGVTRPDRAWNSRNWTSYSRRFVVAASMAVLCLLLFANRAWWLPELLPTLGTEKNGNLHSEVADTSKLPNTAFAQQDVDADVRKEVDGFLRYKSESRGFRSNEQPHELSKGNAAPIKGDTDGVLFVGEKTVPDEEHMETWVKRLESQSRVDKRDGCSCYQQRLFNANAWIEIAMTKVDCTQKCRDSLEMNQS